MTVASHHQALQDSRGQRGLEIKRDWQAPIVSIHPLAEIVD